MRLAITALILSLTGCATLDRLYDEARWKYDGMETAAYTWHVESDPIRCGFHYAKPAGPVWGCAVRVMDSTPQPNAKPVPGSSAKSGHCFIFSNSPEEDAKRVLTKHGDDLHSHELTHCRGMVHPH